MKSNAGETGLYVYPAMVFVNWEEKYRSVSAKLNTAMQELITTRSRLVLYPANRIREKMMRKTEKKIQLLHPAGKHAVRMDKGKYETMREAILSSLKRKNGLTHTEMLHEVIDSFAKQKLEFEGSVAWYMESVKLDLEARQAIKRVSDKKSVRFALFD